MVTLVACGPLALALALSLVRIPDPIRYRIPDPIRDPIRVRISDPMSVPISNTPQTVVTKPVEPGDPPRPLPPGVFRAGDPGSDVSMPQLKTQVLPTYPHEAMRAQIQGVVRLDVIVGVDGKVSDVRVVRSLDVVYGLDEAAVKAVKQWTFEPGEKDGVAVPVLITVDSTFTMSPSVRPTRTRR